MNEQLRLGQPYTLKIRREALREDVIPLDALDRHGNITGELVDAIKDEQGYGVAVLAVEHWIPARCISEAKPA
jgi:hypothetical protein